MLKCQDKIIKLLEILLAEAKAGQIEKIEVSCRRKDGAELKIKEGRSEGS